MTLLNTAKTKVAIEFPPPFRSKRGRPPELKKERDFGTPELQRKKILRTGKASKAHLSGSFPGLLHARGYLTEEEYETCHHFLKLTWSVQKIMGAPALSSLNIQKALQIYGSIGNACGKQRSPQSYGDEKMFEEEDLKKLALYSILLDTLKDLTHSVETMTINLLRYDQVPPKLMDLLICPGKGPPPQMLRDLKTAIGLMTKVFDEEKSS